MPSAAPSESFAFSLVRLSRRVPAWATIAAATALVSMAGLAVRGLNDNGWRLASQLAWRFTMLVYLLAIVAGPVGRLVSWQGLRALYRERRQFIWGFSASFAIFLATVLLPNVSFRTPAHGGPGMLLFLVFGASLTAVTAYAAGPKAALAAGEAARRALLGVGFCYFWLVYLISSLFHLSDPAPDVFYALSVTLLVAALLLRLADSAVAKLRVGRQA